MSNKKVIYTTITGNYDIIPQPTVIARDFDYILFTNDLPEQQLGVWQVRAVPIKALDNVKLSRWVKTHPHILLNDYDVSLYHDCNVIVDQYEYYDRINELIDEEAKIAFMNHIQRNCIYDEGFEVLYLNLAKVGTILSEMAHIKHDGYPINNGLVEANCILRRHHNSQVIQFCEKWWYMIDHYAQRDQLSCNYVAWKIGLDIKLILPPDYSTRNSPLIHCNKHQRKTTIEDVIWYGSLKDRFAKQVRDYYNKFINSKNYSFKEYYSYIMMIIIRKFFALVVLKYKLGTWLKTRNR